MRIQILFLVLGGIHLLVSGIATTIIKEDIKPHSFVNTDYVRGNKVLASKVIELNVGDFIHPKEIMNEDVHAAFQLVYQHYKKSDNSVEQEPTQDQIQQALTLLNARDQTKATMTLIGYKGGAMASQINQDRAVIVSPYIWWNDKFDTIEQHQHDFIVGAFDGHGGGGEIVSEFVATQLPKLLAYKLQQTTPLDSTKISKLLHETFIELDESSPSPASLTGGCAASIVVRIGSKLYVANAGDSRTLVGVSTQSEQATSMLHSVHYVTREDKPHLPDERARVESRKGQVYIPPNPGGTSRVMHTDPETGGRFGLAMSRSIGDWNVGQYGVIPDPIIEIIDLDNFQQQCTANQGTCANPQDASNLFNLGIFVASASDGLFDFVTPEDLAFAVGQTFYGTANSHPIATLGDLMSMAVHGWNDKHGGRYRDDIVIAVHKVIL